MFVFVLLAADDLPPALQTVGVTERLGAEIPAQLSFEDHRGKPVTLAEVMRPDRPTLLTLNYYRCTMLCSAQLQGLTAALSALDLTPGEDFSLVTVSIDPREGAAVASGKRASLLGALDEPAADWTLLTGEEPAITELSKAVGFSAKYDANTDQWAHPAAVILATPTGHISRYLSGVRYSPRDLELAILEAGEGTVGSPLRQVFLSCFRYDEDSGRYTPYIWGILRVAGGATTLGILGLVVGLRRRG